METKLINGETWYDTDGNILHAHGGICSNGRTTGIGMGKTGRITGM